MTEWPSWNRVAPSPFHEESTWIVMGLQMSKFPRVMSVQTRHSMVLKASLCDSFHVNSVPFLSSSQRGAVKDESDCKNGDKYVTMPRNFWSCFIVSGRGMLCNVLTLVGSVCAPSLSQTHPKKVTDGCLTAQLPSLNTRPCS